MPFVLPYSLLEADEVAFVLAFGKLSVLEACTILGRSVRRAEAPCDRVSVLNVERLQPDRVAELSGVHKCAPLTTAVGSSSDDLSSLVDLMTDYVEPKSNVSLSGYDIHEDDYEDLVRSMLDGLRDAGLRKVRLLRPKGSELFSESVLSRNVFDVVAFPYHDGFGLGPTTWVPDSASMRQRGTRKPAPHPDIEAARFGTCFWRVSSRRRFENPLPEPSARSRPAVRLGNYNEKRLDEDGSARSWDDAGSSVCPLPTGKRSNDSGLHANRSAGPRQPDYFFRSLDHLGDTHGCALDDHRVLRCER